MHKRLLMGIFLFGVTCSVLAERLTNESALEAGIYSQIGSRTSVQQAHEDEVLYASTYFSETPVTSEQSEADYEAFTNTYSPSLAAEFNYTDDSQRVKSSSQIHKEINTSSTVTVVDYQNNEEYTQIFPSVSTGQMEQDFKSTVVESHTHAAVGGHYNSEPYNSTTLSEVIDHALTNATTMNKKTDTQTSQLGDAEQLIKTVSREVHQATNFTITVNQSIGTTALPEEYVDYPLPLTMRMSKETDTSVSLVDGVEQRTTTVSPSVVHQTAELDTTGNHSSIVTALSEEYTDYPFTMSTSKKTDNQTSLTDRVEQLITTVSLPKIHQTAGLGTTVNQSSIVTVLSEENMDYPSRSTEGTSVVDDTKQLITAVSSPDVYQTADPDSTVNQSNIFTLSGDYADYPLTTSMSEETDTQTSLVDGAEQLITVVVPGVHQTTTLSTTLSQLSISTTLSEEHMDYPLSVSISMTKETETNGTKELITTVIPEIHQAADLDNTVNQSSISTVLPEEDMDYSLSLTTNKENDNQTSLTDRVEQLITTADLLEVDQTTGLDNTLSQTSILSTLSAEHMDYPLLVTTSASKQTDIQTSLADGTVQLSTKVSPPEVHQTSSLDTIMNQSSISTALSEKHMDYPLSLTTRMSRESGTQTSFVDDTEQIITTVIPDVHQTVDLDTIRNQSSIGTTLSEEYIDFPLPLTMSTSKETESQTSLTDTVEQLITTVIPYEVHQTTDLDTALNPSSIATALSEEYVDYPRPLTTNMSEGTNTGTSLVDGNKLLITTVALPEVHHTVDLDTAANETSTDTRLSAENTDYPLSMNTSKEGTSEVDGIKQTITTVSSHEVHQTADVGSTENQSSISIALSEEYMDYPLPFTTSMGNETTTAPDTHQTDNGNTSDNQHVIFDENLELMMNSTDSSLIAHDLLDLAGILENNVVLDANGNHSSLGTNAHDLLSGTSASTASQTLSSEDKLNVTTMETEGHMLSNTNKTKHKYLNSKSHGEAGSPFEYNVFQMSTQSSSENLWRTEESVYESTVVNNKNGESCKNQQSCGGIMESMQSLDTSTKSSTDIPVQYHTNDFISGETVTQIQDFVFNKEVMSEETDPENITTEIYTVPIHIGENLSTGHQKRSTSGRNETQLPSSTLVDTNPDTVSLVPSISHSVEIPEIVDDREQVASDTIVTLQYPRHQNLTAYNWTIGSTLTTAVTDKSISHINRQNENQDVHQSPSSADRQTSNPVSGFYSMVMNTLTANISVTEYSELSDVNTHQNDNTTLSSFAPSNSDDFHETVHTNIYGTMETVYNSETVAEINTKTSVEQNTYSSEFHYVPLVYASDDGKNNMTDSHSDSLTSGTPELIFSTKTTLHEPITSQASTGKIDISFDFSSQTPSSSGIFSSSHFGSKELHGSITDSLEYLAEESQQSLSNYTEAIRDSRTVSDMHSHVTDHVVRLLLNNQTSGDVEQHTAHSEPFLEVSTKEMETSFEISIQSNNSEATFSFDDLSASELLAESHSTFEYVTQESEDLMHLTRSTLLMGKYSDTKDFAVQMPYSQSLHSSYTTDQHVSSPEEVITVTLKESESRMLTGLEISTPSESQTTTSATLPIQNDTILSQHSTDKSISSLSSIGYFVTTDYNQTSETQTLPSFDQKHISSSFSAIPGEEERPTTAYVSSSYDSYSSEQSVDSTATTYALHAAFSKDITPTNLKKSSAFSEEERSASEVLLDSTMEIVSLTKVSEMTSSLTKDIFLTQNHSTTSVLHGTVDTMESVIYTISEDTTKTSQSSHSAIDFHVFSDIMEVSSSAVMPSPEPKSTEISTTEYDACKYTQEFLATQSEIVITKKEHGSLTTDQMNNTITVVFQTTQGEEQIDLYTKRFNMWMVQVLLEATKEHKMKSLSPDAPSSHEDASGLRVELIYILPTPNIVSEDLIFTFFALIAPSNETVLLSEVIDAVLSDAEGMQNCMNLNLSYFIRGQYPVTMDISQSLNQVWQKYGILLVTISVLTVLIVVIMIAAVLYLRCRSRRSVAYISDKDRLHCDLHTSTEIGDLNRGSVILEDEVFEKDTSLVNGNHVPTIGDDEGWLVPINDVPMEDQDAPDVQDTKL